LGVKAKELFYLFGLKPEIKTFGFEIRSFELQKEGRVEYAQWLHPREHKLQITQEMVDELRKFLSPGEVAIDIGAHSGDSTLPIALAVGKGGCVLALEPNKYVFPVLEKNSELNADKTNVLPLMFAATPKDAEFEFQYSDSGYCNGGRFEGLSRWRHAHAFKLAVQGKNLQSFLRAAHPQLISRIRYIKIDAEGQDYAILNTLSDLITRAKPFLRVEMFKKLNAEQRCMLYQFVAGRGYKVYKIASEANYLGELVRESDLGKWRHFDAFCVPA
jgi:FkbM family methyltransferase